MRRGTKVLVGANKSYKRHGLYVVRFALLNAAHTSGEGFSFVMAGLVPAIPIVMARQ
jgi:hypothetical protein